MVTATAVENEYTRFQLGKARLYVDTHRFPDDEGETEFARTWTMQKEIPRSGGMTLFARIRLEVPTPKTRWIEPAFWLHFRIWDWDTTFRYEWPRSFGDLREAEAFARGCVITYDSHNQHFGIRTPDGFVFEYTAADGYSPERAGRQCGKTLHRAFPAFEKARQAREAEVRQRRGQRRETVALLDDDMSALEVSAPGKTGGDQ